MKLLCIVTLMLALTILVNSRSNGKSILTGTVYDAYGAVIGGSKVTAINSKGEKFETRTKDDGTYTLELAFSKQKTTTIFKQARYDIVVESPGFLQTTIKGFSFVPSYKGKMQLDIALEVGPCSDCHLIVSR